MSDRDRSDDHDYAVLPAEELEPGERVVVEVRGREIAVFNLDGEYHAYLNWCAHQGGPICEGEVTGRVEATFDRETLETHEEWVADETLVCPWHDWEYDVRTGECLSADFRLPTYPVHVEDGEIRVRVR